MFRRIPQAHFAMHLILDPTPDKLLRDALALPPAFRAALAGALIESLDVQPDPQAEAEWEAEIARRIRKLDAGSVSLVSWSEARRAIGCAIEVHRDLGPGLLESAAATHF